eukprot:474937-Pelagomonas_calceolata.AAC.1
MACFNHTLPSLRIPWEDNPALYSPKTTLITLKGLGKLWVFKARIKEVAHLDFNKQGISEMGARKYAHGVAH